MIARSERCDYRELAATTTAAETSRVVDLDTATVSDQGVLSGEGVGVVCEDVCVYVRKQKAILKGISCAVKPAAVMCLMGPSGSGKTTLLNAIACRVSKRRVQGRISFNNVPVTPSLVKYCSSYVMAVDYMLPYLTVEETMKFNCLVRQPRKNEEDRNALVEEMLELLELSELKDSYVGGEWKKGLSTGQIKRLSIAVELLSDAPVLLLDEPTTGLDSKLALQLVRILKNIAIRQGKTVIVSIHQPSNEAFSLFDSLLLIAKGKVLYHGNTKSALEYFGRIGHVCPSTFNPADFLIELVTDEKDTGKTADDRIGGLLSLSSSESMSSLSSGSVTSDKSYKEDKKKDENGDADWVGRRQFCGQRLCEYGPFYSTAAQIDAMSLVFRDSPEYRQLLETQSQLKQISDDQVHHAVDAKIGEGQIGWRAQFAMIWKRTTLNSLRNPMTVLIIVLINVIQALLLGSIFWQLGSDMVTVKSAPLADLEIWNSAAFQFFAHGLDFNGLDPIPDLINKGVDTNNRSVLFDVLTSQDLLQYVHETVLCVYREAGLEGQYPENNWMATTAAPGAKKRKMHSSDDGAAASMLLFGKSDGPLSLNTNDKSVGDSHTPFQMVSMPIDQAMTDIVSLIQILDHYLLKVEYEVINSTDSVAFWTSVFVKYGKYVDPLLYCVGLPVWENNFTSHGPPATEPNPLEPHNYNSPYYPGNGRVDMPSAEAAYRRRQLLEAAVPFFNTRRSREEKEIQQAALDMAQAATHGKNRRRAPQRKLSSGLSGLIEDLIDIVLKNPNSPFYALYQASSYYSDRLASCDYYICQNIQDGIDSFSQVMMDSMTTIMTTINFAGAIFFFVACIGFSSYDVLLQLPKERPIFNKEHLKGLYRSTSYFLAKSVADFPFQLIPCLLWSTLIYLMAGLALTAKQYFTYMGIAICTSYAAYGFGYLISAASPRMEVAIILAPLLLVIMLVLAGFFIRDAQLASWISWFKYFSIYRWGFFSMLVNQFPPGENYGNLPCSLLLLVSGVTDIRLWFDIMILLILGTGYRICAYFALIFMNTSIGIEA